MAGIMAGWGMWGGIGWGTGGKGVIGLGILDGKDKGGVYAI